MIVRENEPITLIGGAAVTLTLLARARALAPIVVAADGGADAALAHGAMPQAVIGDFDSISEDARARISDTAQHPIADQDSTDFDKCLGNIASPLIIGIGFSGDRLDHQLAAYNTLVRHPWQRCILLGREELVFLAPPSIDIDLEADCPVSLFPMGAVEGISDGLAYPIGGLNFAPDGRVGTSNTALGPVHLSVTAPKMLVILPQSTLEDAARALSAGKTRWPGP
ncbi:Thiamin pyrophosphokinase, catalytic domain [Roseovarius gaetbuli]|uniref:Thiamine diphosphokinase n=1 Tax=Roseovarius gaetbuli TaxID=1356575 RepID=A0A1X6ZF49_9RHOB|nr:thiamine diphosphokinase [Roseovarius gaetbuli]SLN49178.1 Thiamin pyrophosphokinase, catalytic domain [Roseovarius gaetbuli]